MKTNQKDHIKITRKIKLIFNIDKHNHEEISEAFKKLYNWQFIVFKALNISSSLLFMQEQLKELSFFNDEYLIALTDSNSNANGIFNCSRMSTIYRSIAQKFKYQIPTDILSCITQLIYHSFNKEKHNYFNGIKSLRNYKKDIPIPFSSHSLYNFKYNDTSKNFTFSLFKHKKYKIPFQTILGKDKSNNEAILKRCINDEYKFCESSIQITENKKIFLLLTIKIPTKDNHLNYNTIVTVHLSYLSPIILKINNKEYQIGNSCSYIYKRHAIQKGVQRSYNTIKYNKGGKGRNSKFHKINQLKKKERLFIQNYMHKISRMIIDFCLQNNAGKLNLISIDKLTTEAIQNPHVLRNWSYGNLLKKIEYKCQLNRIEFSIL